MLLCVTFNEDTVFLPDDIDWHLLRDCSLRRTMLTHSPCTALVSLLSLLSLWLQELLIPGGELRGTSTPLLDRDVFLLQFGESDETLREGRMVEAKVRDGPR